MDFRDTMTPRSFFDDNARQPGRQRPFSTPTYGPGRMPRVPMGGAAPMSPVPPPPAAASMPMTPAAAPANRFGWTQNFADSVNRQRALRSYKSATFADRRAAGDNERDAAQRAFSQTQFANADMQSGNFFENRGLTADANRRANVAADTQGAKTWAEGLEAHSRGTIGIPAQAAEYQARASTLIPAQARSFTEQAETESATRGPRVAEIEQKIRHADGMLPLQRQAAEAEIWRSLAGVPAMQQQYGDLQDRNQVLEQRLIQKLGLEDEMEAIGAGRPGANKQVIYNDKGEKVEYDGKTWKKVSS